MSDTIRDQIATAVAAEVQLRLPYRDVRAQYGYIYIDQQAGVIFWPDGVSVDLGSNTALGNKYFWYTDPAFPDNLIDFLIIRAELGDKK